MRCKGCGSGLVIRNVQKQESENFGRQFYACTNKSCHTWNGFCDGNPPKQSQQGQQQQPGHYSSNNSANICSPQPQGFDLLVQKLREIHELAQSMQQTQPPQQQ